MWVNTRVDMSNKMVEREDVPRAKADPVDLFIQHKELPDLLSHILQSGIRTNDKKWEIA